MKNIPARSGGLASEKQKLLELRLRQRGISVLGTQTIPRRKQMGPCPLSFAQERLWFLDQLEPDSTAYLLPSTFRLHGTLDTQCLERSLHALIQRHESLRTTFQEQDEQAVQVIHPVGRTRLPIIDLQGLRSEQREEQAQRLAKQEAQRPCNLVTGPLLRTSLLRLAGWEHLMLLTLHHIITDRWSNGVLMSELTTLYYAFVAQQPSPLPPLALQYADYALWQREFLQREVLENQLAYWKKQLADLVPLQLPVERSGMPGLQSGMQMLALSAPLSQALTQLSAQEHASIFQTLLAAFQTLLSHWCGQEDIVVGTDVTNRERLETEGLIGFFVNQLVLRSRVSGNQTFRELLRSVQHMTLEAYAHQDLPFEKLVEALRPQRSRQIAPLFQVKLLVDQPITVPPMSSDGLVVRPEGLLTDTTQIDLLLRLTPTPEGLRGSLTYRTDLFDAITIETLAQQFIYLLEEIGTNPNARIRTLIALMTKKAREQQAIEGFGLSLQQARVWTLQQEQDVYRSQCTIRIKGPLHLPTLRESVQSVLSRHEVYRTSFQRVPSMKLPLQVVHSSPLWLWQSVDLGCLSPQRQYEQQERLAQESKALPLDWEQGPLVVCTLLTLAPEDHLLLMYLPTLLADSASLNLFFQELSTCYPHPRPAAAAELESLPYLQVSEMQTALLEERDEQEIRHHLSWWEQTGAALTDLTLPFEHKGTQPISFSPHVVTVSLDSEEVAPLHAFLQERSCSWPAFLLASFQLLLYRLTGRTDLLLGVEIDGRSFEDLAGISGLLSKELPLLCHLNANVSLTELLEQTQKTYQDLLSQYPAFSWEDMERVAPLRYPYSFAFREQPHASQKVGVSWALQHVQAYGEPFKVKLIAVRAADALDIEMHYDSNRFDPYDIERLTRQFTSLLTQAIRQPEARLAALEMLGDAEREYLLVEWNQTQQTYPEGQCVHQLIEQQVQRTPDAILVRSAQGQVTYQVLDGRANQLAHALRERGVQPEVLVGLCLPREPECLIAILGILKAGGAYLPLEADQPPQRLAGMLEEAKPVLLLTTSARQHLMPPNLPLLLLDTEASTLTQYPAESAPKSQIEPENLAYVLYTSGSTGKPKGVMISQQGLLQYVYWATRRYEVADGGGCPLHSSLAFDLTVTSLFAPLVVGRAVSLVGEEQGIQGLADALRQKQDFSLVKLTPTHLELLSQMLAPAELAGQTRLLIVGGEALRWEHVARWREYAPDTGIINEYGPTETVVGCCIYEIPADEAAMGTIPIGRPIANTQLYILDAHLRPVPVGGTGEIFIGGIGVARGYLQRADWTAERFLPNPFGGQPGARLYRTGDLGRHRGDGELEYLGRMDQQVKVRGYRVELGEIEAVLVQHAGIREAVVQVRRSPGGEAELVAYVLAVQGKQSLALGELREYLGERLPKYMVPTSVVVLQAWPLTSNGKVDRQALLAMESTAEEKAEVEETPRTAVQEVIAGLWCSVLGRAHVGLWENFFDLGGHSLLVTRLISRLKSVMGVEVPVHVVFDQPTVAGLAQWVELAWRQGERIQIPALVAQPRPETIPMSFAQQRLWFLDRLEPGSAAYLVPHVQPIHGPLNAKALDRSLAEMICRHEILRTTFVEQANQPVQVIHPAGRSSLPLIDLRAIEPEKRKYEVQRLIRLEAQRPCDLACGPLWRTTVLRLASEEYVLLMTLHHIITDGWSNEVLSHELLTLYQAFAVGLPSPLAPLSIQYADYALWQRAWLQGEVLEAQLDYWERRLGGVPPLELSADYPRPLVRSSHGAGHPFTLSAELTQALLTLGLQSDVTLFMTLLAAFQVFFSRSTGQTDIVVGTDSANRNQIETEGMLGFFVNLLALRTDLSGNPSFREVLRRVRGVVLGAYIHQETPFELLIEKLAPDRLLDRTPLVNVLFVLQNRSLTSEQVTSPASNAEQERTNQPSPLPQGDKETLVKFDLALFMLEHAGSLSGVLQYRRDLFKASTIATLVARFQTLLQNIVQQPDIPINLLKITPDAEHSQQEQQQREFHQKLRVQDDIWFDLPSLDE